MTRFNASDRNLKALVINDTAFVRKVVAKSLTELGVVNIVEASDAAEAVRRLRSENFDLVVSDSNLPTMTGFELLRYIRNHARLKNTPFLMLTANTDNTNVMQASDASISDFLTKPFSAEALETKILNLIPKVGVAPGKIDSTS
jgi:two-component system chemotaxis response regulator CheY